MTVALTTLAGSPPAVFFALLVAVPFGAGCAVETLRLAALARALATAAVVYLALALPMLAPARELARWSVQSAHTFARIAAEGRPLHDAAGLALPAMTDHHYVGLATLALGAWAFAGSAAWRPRWIFLGVGVFGFAMTFGAHTPLFRLAYAVVPGVAAFRNPTRYAALYGTCAAVLAAAGVERALSAQAPAAWRRRWALACGAVVAACGGVYLAPRLDPWTHGDGVGRAGLALAAVAAAVLALRRTRAAVPVIVVALAVDLWPLLPPARHTRPGPFPERAALVARVREMLDAEPGGRVYDEFGVGFRAGSRHGWREFRGYQDPMQLSRYQKVVGALARTPALLATFGVRWVLWGPHYHGDEGHHYLPDPAGGTWARPLAPGVYAVQGALPAAWWMDGAEVVPDADAALARVCSVAPAPRVVLEGSDPVGAGRGRYLPAAARFDDDRVTVDLEAPDDGWLVVNEAFYPGWRAWVDQRPAAIRRANSFVRAVRVPRGRHRVTMVFAPRAPRLLEPLAALTWLALGLWGLYRLRSRWRRPGGP